MPKMRIQNKNQRRNSRTLLSNTRTNTRGNNMNNKHPPFFHRQTEPLRFVGFVPRLLAPEPTTQEIYDIMGTIIVLTSLVGAICYLIATFAPEHDTIYPVFIYTILMIIYFWHKTKKIRKDQP